MRGLLLIDKPQNMTSRDVVNIATKKLNTKKVGHTGTLDPLATGLLVLAVGDTTKLVEIAVNHEKEYIVEAILGIETDTLDREGATIHQKKTKLSKKEVEEALIYFKKEYNQTVPKYSAIKINGKKLYEYARENIEIELPARKVTIKEIELLEYIQLEETVNIKFRTKVSKGTYIRSLVRDIAHHLNTYGMMSELRRTEVGAFKLSDSIKIEDISTDKLIKDDIILSKYKKVELKEPLLKMVKCGRRIENTYNEDMILFVDEADEKVALYKKYDKDETKLKPFKMFQINK